MTELHFVLDVDPRLSMALSYRFHACGLVEILVDERPWCGLSPWIDRKGEIRLLWGEPGRPIAELVNRPPLYGFKDYAEIVKHVAAVHRRAKATVLELGEETTNGRRWNRRLYLVPGDCAEHAAEFAQAVNKGPIVNVKPLDLPLSNSPIRVACPAQGQAAAEVLVEALRKKGVTVEQTAAGTEAVGAEITLQLVEPTRVPNIEGDGFEIQPALRDGGVVIRACTRFGLVQGTLRAAEYLARPAAGTGMPLVAENPAVDFRAGGFGGGTFEVDFPYGTEAEWRQALDQLVASGMNVMTDLGMWSNWKMPVTYRYMPELQSTAADAYDEVSGAKLAEAGTHRERGRRLVQYLHARGVKVWLWLPVGCVPSTYATRHPEAMAANSRTSPCFTHPLYNRYLEAFVRELLETYAIDGMVMIRDDNGGLCSCRPLQSPRRRDRRRRVRFGSNT